MASSGKKKTTMAKLQREGRLRERRLDKQARKVARKHAAANPVDPLDESSLLDPLDESSADDAQAPEGDDVLAVEGEPRAED